MHLLLTTFLVLSLLSQVIATDDTFLVRVNVNLARGKKGSFVLEVHPAWAPLGAERMREIVTEDVSTSTLVFLSLFYIR